MLFTSGVDGAARDGAATRQGANHAVLRNMDNLFPHRTSGVVKLWLNRKMTLSCQGTRLTRIWSPV